MSLSDLTAFFERLQTDAALQEKTRELFGADDREEALCRLAAGEGFDFTVEELRSEQAKPALAGLDDESLKEVVGGIGCDIPGGILFHPAGHPEPMG